MGLYDYTGLPNFTKYFQERERLVTNCSSCNKNDDNKQEPNK